MNMNNPHVQQLLRAGLMGQASLSQNMAAALMRPQSQSSVRPPPTQQALNKTFPGKLTQIKEFPIEKSNQQPYKLQKALIDQKIVPCINVRPYVFHDLMVRVDLLRLGSSFLNIAILLDDAARFCKAFFPRPASREVSRDAAGDSESCPLQRKFVSNSVQSNSVIITLLGIAEVTRTSYELRESAVFTTLCPWCW